MKGNITLCKLLPNNILPSLLPKTTINITFRTSLTTNPITFSYIITTNPITFFSNIPLSIGLTVSLKY